MSEVITREFRDYHDSVYSILDELELAKKALKYWAMTGRTSNTWR